MFRLYKRLAVSFFGKYAEMNAFKKLKPDLQAAGIHILLKPYASMVMLTSVLAFLVSLAVLLAVFSFVKTDILSFVLFVVNIPFLAGLSTFFLLYIYPSQKAKSVRKSLENDMPFAVAHMSAIASSGISPEFMFDLLAEFREYKDVAKHASLVVRNIKTFGMSSVAAIKSVASTTPSPSFKQVLNGIAFNIEKGGNLPKYLREMAEKSLFDYRIKRERYLKTLSTYADIYTALLVAAPLMMLAVLAILSVIGGEVIGMSIPDLITLLTFVILPSLNAAFLAFIHLTYSGV
jgi:flagellar protein FlaJ